ncbi:hypothetical protein [Terriglobus aquaticus]|uniref:Uncharacterized protein n=1 Tax=Terriglobus aquaticus TaxID=940139 RepID=A0ABW9KH83_9BACT|nr:hypothetical protein [Terriglobus aquaticus]
MFLLSSLSIYPNVSNRPDEIRWISLWQSFKRLLLTSKEKTLVISLDQFGCVWCEVRHGGLRFVRCFEGVVQAAEELRQVGLISSAYCLEITSGLNGTAVANLHRDYDVSFLPWLGFDMDTE